MGYPNVDHYQALARHMGVESYVTFTGRVPFEQAPGFLAACDIAVAPKMSTSEGSGKLLNYMAMAQPIVAYDTPVNREYLAELGLYAPPGDVSGLAEQIGAVMGLPDLGAERGALLRQRAIAAFSWDAAAERIHQLYTLLTTR
jgi:glycosyltransferase involved in cell wall biosynthesis